MIDPKTNSQLSKNFESETKPKWCPGCGNHSVFKSLTSVFAELNIPKEDFVVISGIGCSSRFPYYLNTFGFHSIHGRAPTIATGLKLSRPELSVWVMTGDGDALSIGGNHFTHTIRRNSDIKILLFNNEIYGLTKGQLSPTSRVGLKTKTSPFGSIENPVRPLPQAVSVGATFAARVTYADIPFLKKVFKAAALHKGIAIIEILTNCIIFADGLFNPFTKKNEKDEHTIKLENGAPLIFGKNKDKGIILNGFKPKIVKIGENGITEDKLLHHDENVSECNLAYILSSMQHPEFPIPLGIFRKVQQPTYEESLKKLEDRVTREKGKGDVQKLLFSGDTWTVDENGKAG